MKLAACLCVLVPFVSIGLFANELPVPKAPLALPSASPDPAHVSELEQLGMNHRKHRHPRLQEPLIRLSTPIGPLYIQGHRYQQIIDLDRLDEQTTIPLSSASFRVGDEIVGLPEGFSTFLHEDKTFFHYEGAFFEQIGDKGFVVIAPPIGATLRELPASAQPIQRDGETQFHANGAFYRPVPLYGETAYQVVAE